LGGSTLKPVLEIVVGEIEVTRQVQHQALVLVLVLVLVRGRGRAHILAQILIPRALPQERHRWFPPEAAIINPHRDSLQRIRRNLDIITDNLPIFLLLPLRTTQRSSDRRLTSGVTTR
jgi:hypothetical protein